MELKKKPVRKQWAKKPNNDNNNVEEINFNQMDDELNMINQELGKYL